MPKPMDNPMARYENEILSDNTQFTNCEQCKTCMFAIGSTMFSNRFDKSSCRMYEHPNMKPIGVIKNTENCDYYEKASE